MREKILTSVREQILKNGFRKFTIDDICTDMKISKKTIYKYFGSKDEMISEIVDAHVETDRVNTLKALEESKSIFEKLNSVILCYYDYNIPLKIVDELRKSFPQQWSKIEGLFKFKQELFLELINKGIEEGCIERGVNIDVLMLVIRKTIPAILDYDFLANHDKSSKTANYMLEELSQLIIYGIVKS